MWHHELAKVYQVRQNLWAIDEIGKTTLYVYEGEKRVLLLDTGFGLLPLREMVESLCPGKEIVVVNSHAHGDHASGNCQFDTVGVGRWDEPASHKGMDADTRKRYLLSFFEDNPRAAKVDVNAWLPGPAKHIVPLSDGDVIRVMYTNNTTNDNAGGDLGGTWGNKNTTLSDLTVSGGQLLTEFTPGQSGGTYEYTLAIDSAEANIQVTPTAANKNYLTKIFLNEKVTDNTEGFSFYKRTESIPVKAGDVIYVGCGENGWPTMNGSGQRGTWYVLRVIDVNADASAVTGMINDLPEVSSVKYGNYQLYVNAVAAARASFNALNSKQQKNVDPKKLAELEKLEQAVASFQAIDEVKDKLDKLPGAGDLTIKDRDAVKAAKDAYDKLTPEQKAELTGLEIDKMGELTTRMDEIIKENPDLTPTPGGNTSGGKKPSQSTGKDVKSGNTGDAGVTLYVGLGLVAVLAGAVIVIRKRKEN